jgi:hypothetical protein
MVNEEDNFYIHTIDDATRKREWTYGVADTPGHAPGYLFYPDGMDVDVFRDWKGAVAHP